MTGSSKLSKIILNKQAKSKKEGIIGLSVGVGILAIFLFIFLPGKAVLGFFLGLIILAAISAGVFLILRAIDDLPDAF